MTKQLVKYDFGFPLKADLSVLIMCCHISITVTFDFLKSFRFQVLVERLPLMPLFKKLIFSSPEPLGSQGELIGWP